MNEDTVQGAAYSIHGMMRSGRAIGIQDTVDLIVLGQHADSEHARITEGQTSVQGIMVLAYPQIEETDSSTLLLFRLGFVQPMAETASTEGNHLYLAAIVNQVVDMGDTPKLAERIVIKNKAMLGADVHTETEGRVVVAREVLAEALVWRQDGLDVETGTVHPIDLASMTILLGVNVPDGFPKWVVPTN